MLPKKKIGRKFFVIGIFLFPLLISLYIVSLNSNELISEKLSIPLLLGGTFSFVMLVTGILFYFTGKDKLKRKFKKPLVALFALFATVYTVGGFGVVYELYFSGNEFKEWLVTTAMTTMTHQYFATWFYNEYDVSTVLANNTVIETAEDTDTDLVDFTAVDFDKVTFANEYEKEVLTKNEGNDLYKIIDIKEPNLKGKLAVVYDASKVKVGVSAGSGTSLSNAYGQYITKIASRYNAITATNAGGFYDPDWNSTGGVPHGIVISDGKLIANNAKAPSGGGIVGFTKDNKLVLTHLSAQQALNQGIRDCVEFGPFLIVNGKSSFVNGNGGWGQAPRTAIGQRADGIVLLLVIDGRQTGSIGADMNDLTRIMLNYGAINAANMDGGTSSAMSLNGEIITNPRNGSFAAQTRPVPNAWMVVQ
jgi:exopolysaccharide biosynthesis protein